MLHNGIREKSIHINWNRFNDMFAIPQTCLPADRDAETTKHFLCAPGVLTGKPFDEQNQKHTIQHNVCC